MQGEATVAGLVVVLVVGLLVELYYSAAYQTPFGPPSCRCGFAQGLSITAKDNIVVFGWQVIIISYYYLLL